MEGAARTARFSNRVCYLGTAERGGLTAAHPTQSEQNIQVCSPSSRMGVNGEEMAFLPTDVKMGSVVRTRSRDRKGLRELLVVSPRLGGAVATPGLPGANYQRGKVVNASGADTITE